MLNPRFIGPTGCLLAGSLLLGGCFDPTQPKESTNEERRIRLDAERSHRLHMARTLREGSRVLHVEDLQDRDAA